jgi:hypothetical protein
VAGCDLITRDGISRAWWYAMPRLARLRLGSPVVILQRKVGFSYWPTVRGNRRYGLQSRVYVANPWALIQTSVRNACAPVALEEAIASLEQAEFFYRSAVGVREWAAKPLPLYYSFMNLAKAFALTRSIRATFDRAVHGISERMGPGGKELIDAVLEAQPSQPGKQLPKVFDDFLFAVSKTRLGAAISYPLLSLLPQIVPAHRIWCDATDSAERFFGIESFPFFFQKNPRDLWAQLHVLQDDLSRVSKLHGDLLAETRLKGVARETTGFRDPVTGRDVVRFEQITPVRYSGMPSDNLADLVGTLRPFVWSTVTTARPFRKYYLYACPLREHPYLLPQVVSIYAIMFYLGSITRYRPQHFANILSGEFGGFMQEFLSSQPSQFLYLMASEFAKRDVARAPLV